MHLDEDEIEVLTAVRVADEMRHREWLEDTLGVTIDLKSLIVKKDGPRRSGPAPSKIRVPLSHLVAVEGLGALIETYKKNSSVSASEGAEVDPDVVQIGNLPQEEAKALLKGMMRIASEEEHKRKQG